METEKEARVISSAFSVYSIDSATELEYHLIVARDLELLSNSDFHSLVDQLVEVRKMICGLINYLSHKTRTSNPERSSSS
jgi:four helix bundle protein